MSSISSILWKNIAKCIFVEEFFEKYENPTTSTIFTLYCFSGGFCFHDDVRPEFRKFWIYFNIFNFIFIYVSCMFYFFDAPLEDFFGWLLPTPVMSGILVKAGTYYWTFSINELFSKLIDTMEDNEGKYDKYDSFCTTLSKKSIMKIVKILFCILALCAMAFNLENFVKYENYFINLYPTYFPFHSTSPLRIVIRFVQTVTLVPEIFSAVALPAFMFIISLDVYNRFELLSLSLRGTTYSVRLNIDEITNMEIAMNEQRISNGSMEIRELKMRKALALDELQRKIIIVAEQHRELYSIAESLAKNLEFIFYAVFAEIFFASLITTFLISSMIDPAHLYRSLTITLVTCGIFIYWLVCCIMGELFQDMNGIVAAEIYESPWYLMKPKDRRLVLTFLTIVQRPISIVVWKIHPVNLGSFPNMVNTVYSNVQRLGTLQLHEHKNSP